MVTRPGNKTRSIVKEMGLISSRSHSIVEEDNPEKLDAKKTGKVVRRKAK